LKAEFLKLLKALLKIISLGWLLAALENILNNTNFDLKMSDFGMNTLHNAHYECVFPCPLF